MTTALPRSAPEAQGIPSAAIRAYVDAALAAGNEMHSLMIVRHGHVVAETWWAPYRPEAVHLLYSLSKSFTATGIGLAIDEGLLGLDDRVVDLFPDRIPRVVDDKLAALRVRHLLSMSAGHEVDSTQPMTATEDWVVSFLGQRFAFEPGAEFLYDTGASYLLSAIISQLTGMRLLDYLRPRLFEPLGIEHAESHHCPMGVDTGGWGMSTTTETLAKFGQLYLQKGLWNGVRLLSEEWVEQATSLQTPTPPDFMDSPEWQQGYGFQFWRCRHNAYRGDGAFGQNCVVMPDQDAVVVMTSRAESAQGLLDMVWDILLPAMSEGPLPADPASADSLAAELGAHVIAPPAGVPVPPLASSIARRTFELEPNDLDLATASLEFGAESFALTLGSSRIPGGYGEWIDGAVDLPHSPPDILTAISEQHPTPVASAGAWRDDRTLAIVSRYYTTPHHDTFTVRLDDDRIEIEPLNSIAAAMRAAYPTLPSSDAEPRPVLRGRRVEGVDR